MTLAAGTLLGPYRIEAAIGAGGMGEVYRARDTRLDRIVAIKVLPAALTSDPQFRERFDREARTISSLNHPHICTLHDIGTQDGVAFLVMEHLDGQTLADRLQNGPLAAADVLRYALQIADALDKAHRRGIVHRDLKPGNVMLTRTGAKLVDFGLARLSSATAPAGGETRLVSVPAAAPITSEGTLLGTFEYMAPEQLQGEDADARADLWAFGCVLYEMSTGRRAFEGKTPASVIAAILERQPPPMAHLQPMTPPAFERVVRTLLAKDREERFQSAFDVALDLKWIQEGQPGGELAAAVIAPRRRNERLGWTAAATVLAATAAVAAWWLKPAPAVDRVVSRFAYPLPQEQAFTRAGRRVVAISPDGRRIAYVANKQLYVRALDQVEPQPIPGTNEDPLEPVFSPDGQWIAYFVPDTPSSSPTVTLRKIPAAGGPAVTLCQLASLPSGASWSNGTIAFGQFVAAGVDAIEAVPDSGGTARVIASVDPKDGRASQPQLLDDGTRLLFAVVRPRVGNVEGQIFIQNLDGSSRRLLVTDGSNPQVVSDRLLLYTGGSTMFGVAFDAVRGTVTGSPVVLLQGVMMRNSTGEAQFGVSRNGTLVYVPDRGGKRVLVWVDQDSHEHPIAMPPRGYSYPRLSPDGTRIAVTSDDDDSDVWIWDVQRDAPLRLTTGAAVELYPTWMPDGRRIVFRSGSGSSLDIFRKAADGTGATEALTTNSGGGEPLSVSPDGKQLVYRRGAGVAHNDLMLLPLDGSGPARPLLANPAYNERNAEISPDGRWLAYESDDSGQPEVYVRPFPNVDAGRWPVSSNGGTRPAWARSGRELFFESGNPAHLIAVSIQTGATLTYGKPRTLFDVTRYQVGERPGRDYDVAADGRFLLTRPVDRDVTAGSGFVVVSQWIDEVRGRVK
jgi:serine/threonine-protein kinase